jgi:hypothetical protein
MNHHQVDEVFCIVVNTTILIQSDSRDGAS